MKKFLNYFHLTLAVITISTLVSAIIQVFIKLSLWKVHLYAGTAFVIVSVAIALYDRIRVKKEK